jgi:hypothetical protein
MTLPQIGETWTHRLVHADGIVARVVGTIVTFVSLTGNRASIQFNRQGAAENTPPDWVLKSPAPSWFQSCSRERCPGSAFIRYVRPPKDVVELVCPAHVPKGIKSEASDKPFLVTGFFHGSTCLACGQDGIEVFGELPWSRQQSDSLWCCSVCSEWWLLTNWGGFSTDFTNQQAAMRCPAGFMFQSVVGREETTLLPGWTYRVRVRIQLGHVLMGVRPPTIYDHLKERDAG